MEAIGAIGSVVGIIEIITRSVLTLNNLRKRTKEAEVTVSILISQLSIIRAALDQIRKWTDESLRDDVTHYQLIIDLETSLDSCKLLTSLIDSQLSRLEWKESDQLKFESKIRMVLNEQSTKDCLNYLGHQTSALNLLLTAFKCRTPSDQKSLLEEEKSRETLDQVKDDSSSLIVLYDNASTSSHRTTTTTATSKFSIRFSFDAELLKAKAYQSSFRSLMRRYRSKPSPNDSPYNFLDNVFDGEPSAHPSSSASMPTSTSDPKTSEKISRMLKEENRRLQKEVTILALGGPDSGISEIVRQMKMANQVKYSSATLTHFRHLAIKRIILSLRAKLEALEDDTENRLHDADKANANIVKEHDLDSSFGSMPQDVAVACEAIWETIKKGKHKEDDYFLDSIARILRPDYTPSQGDIVRLEEPPLSVLKETIFNMGEIQIRVIEFNGTSFEHRKVLDQFENVTAILFAVDLSSYDQLLDDDKDITPLHESLAQFESIVKSRWFARSSVILFFGNIAMFEAKLEKMPFAEFARFFPDYTKTADANGAVEYILERFSQLNCNNLELYFHMINQDGANNVRFMFAAVEDIIKNNYMYKK